MPEPGTPECSGDYISWLEYPFLHNDTSSRISVIKWHLIPGARGGDESFLHPLPLSFKLNETGAVGRVGIADGVHDGCEISTAIPDACCAPTLSRRPGPVPVAGV